MEKYAIYKSRTGLYSLKYVDHLSSLTGTGFEDFISEEQLPVILDGKGGYFHFDSNEFRFVKIVETDDEPLVLEEMYYKNSPDFKLGWMSPEGDTYSCSYTNHNKCAVSLAKKFFPQSDYPETSLYKSGWVKVIDSWDSWKQCHGQFIYTERERLTNRQINKLYDLGLYNNKEVQELIKKSE